MDGLLRLGAWIALVLAVHAAPLIGVPLWRTAEPIRPWVVTIEISPSFAPLTDAHADGEVIPLLEETHCVADLVPGKPVRPVPHCGPAPALASTKIACLTVPPVVATVSTAGTAVRCDCCQDGCDTCADDGWCECRWPGVYDGPDPIHHPQVRSQIRPADPGCCACTAAWVGK